ncbi:MAG: hypothetical protein J5918_09445 [Prevotella sp.]|nr:hypothetical protein [Prevotella sp.]
MSPTSIVVGEIEFSFATSVFCGTGVSPPLENSILRAVKERFPALPSAERTTGLEVEPVQIPPPSTIINSPSSEDNVGVGLYPFLFAFIAKVYSILLIVIPLPYFGDIVRVPRAYSLMPCGSFS